jgi:hypothetical protein
MYYFDSKMLLLLETQMNILKRRGIEMYVYICQLKKVKVLEYGRYIFGFFPRFIF